MEHKPLVSVIIPLYNAERYIAETLDSVVQQSYSHFEVIVVDNGSTDSSCSIVERYVYLDPRVTMLSLDTNSGGPAKPRNIGLDNAKGEFICFLDADDVWLADKLESQVGVAENGKNFLCSQADYVDAQSQGVKGPGVFQKLFASRRLTVNALSWQNPVITSSVMLKRDLIENSRFDEDPLLAGAEDCVLWMSLLAKKQCVSYLSQDALLLYRILDNSTSRQGGRAKAHVLKEYAMCKFALSHKYYSVQNKHVVKKALRAFLRKFS